MFDCLSRRSIFSNTLKEAGFQMASRHHVHVLLQPSHSTRPPQAWMVYFPQLLQSAAPSARPVREWYTFLNFYAVLHEEGLWFN